MLTVPRSKTDQESVGRRVGVPFGSNPATCPVRAWQAWVKASGIEAGPLFRGIDRHGNIATARLSYRAVAMVVKKRASAAAIDPERVSGHSLRAWLATAATPAAGVSERAIAATNWAQVDDGVAGLHPGGELVPGECRSCGGPLNARARLDLGSLHAAFKRRRSREGPPRLSTAISRVCAFVVLPASVNPLGPVMFAIRLFGLRLILELTAR